MSKGGNLRYELTQEAISGLTDNDTLRTYKRNCEVFASWIKDTYGINRMSKINDKLDVVQQYCEYLQNKSYSADTIHTYLAPVCKGLGVCMSDIAKPVRSVDGISRSRMKTSNLQGKREAAKVSNQRLVSFQKVVGIRRSELADLRARDVVRSQEDDFLYIHVAKGKGGKEQWQRVLPEGEAVVKATLIGLRDQDKIFSKKEMANKIDLHGMRAENARKAYEYYKNRIENERFYRMKLMQELIARFDQGNECLKKSNIEKYLARKERFLSDLGKGKKDYTYVLRGDSAVVARTKQLPLAYDRIALMAVSVFHLSHWRNDVTVKNYLLT